MAGRRLLPHLVGGGALLLIALFVGADLSLLSLADGPAARVQTHRAVGATVDLLQEHGVTTLGQALEISRR